MNIVLIEPGKRPVLTTIDNTLSAMQKMVGGLIQAIYPFEDPVALICNEEGKLQGLAPNRALWHPETGAIYDVIFGPFFLCSALPGSTNFESLTREQIAHYMERFKYPEFFLGIALGKEGR